MYTVVFITEKREKKFYNAVSVHCLGLFERYDSIEDIKKGIKSNRTL